MTKKILIQTFAPVVCLFIVSTAIAQEVQTDWRAERMRLERQYGDALQDIANWARANDAAQQVNPTLELFINRDLKRQYIYCLLYTSPSPRDS